MSDVLINSLTIHDWHYVGTVFTIRFFSDRSWVAADGTVIPARGDTNACYREYTITVVGTDATVPVVSLAPQTSAPNEKNARYLGYYYVDGIERDMFLANTLGAFQIPDTPATNTWSAIEQYNFGVQRRYYKDDNTYSALVIDQKIAASSAANFVDATTVQKGVGKLSTAAVTPTSPIFVGDNDRRVGASYNVTATSIGANNGGNVDNLAVLDTLANTTLQITGAGGEIYLPAGQYLISSDMSFPANVSLRLDPRAMLKPATGAQITILGPIIAGPWKIFTNATAGLGTILFTSSHRLNTIYSEWWGAVADGSTSSYAALAAATSALKTLLSGRLQLNAGTYIGSINLTEVKGVQVVGMGPDTTRVVSNDGTPAAQINGMWRSQLSGIYFQTQASLATKAVFELDGNYDGVHTQSVQGNIFTDVFCDGNNLAKYAFAVGRQGTANAQGSENVWIDCNFQSALRAGYYQEGANALNNLFMGGNWQDMPKYGVELNGGSATFVKPAFQNLVELVDAIANGAYDFSTGTFGTGERITILDADSESALFITQVGGAQTVKISGLTQRGKAVGDSWAALTAFPLKRTFAGTTAAGNMKMFKVTTAGTTGAAQPTWPESGTVVDGSVTWTQVDYQPFDLINGTVEDSLMGRGAQAKASINRTSFYLRNRWTRTDYIASGSAAFGFFHENYTQTGAGNDLLILDALSMNRLAPSALGTTTPLDITATLQTGNIISYTPTQGSTLNATTTPTRNQEFQLVITTSGTTPFDITFGTNFKSQGVFNTGPVSGHVFVLKFVSDGTNYCEVGRASPLAIKDISIATVAAISASSTAYICPGAVVQQASEVNRQVAMPACVVRGLRVNLVATSPAAGAASVTIRKNGADTAVTISIPAGTTAQVLTDLTHAVTFAANDLLSIELTNADALNTWTINNSSISFEVWPA